MASSPILTSNGNTSSSSTNAASQHSPKLTQPALSTAVVTAPQLQGPPSAFITVAPGCHFLSVPSFLSLLPTSNASTASTNTNVETGSTTLPQQATDDTFLRTLAPRTLLLLSPERPPARLERWARSTGVSLIHFGLGPCPAAAITSPTSTTTRRRRRRTNRSEEDEEGEEGEEEEEEEEDLEDSTAVAAAEHEDRLGSHGAEAGLGGDQDRMCNEALAIVLQAARAPLIILDFSGANEGALLVGCLRRLQRRNLASIISEYRTIAGPRARAAHERFIEMFNTSAVDIPPTAQLPDWFAQQLEDDESEAMALAPLPASPILAMAETPSSNAG